jgi:CBS domain-containing protein
LREVESALKVLIIKEALPSIFEVAYPVLDPKTNMLSALSLLRFQEIDALPLSFDSERKQRAVAGFSSLARIMQIDPRTLPKFLKQPCEEVSEPLATVGAERSLSMLLDKFLQTRFGFARVTDRKNVGALARLRDLLNLYGTGRFDANLAAEDVASPIFSLPGETKLRTALEKMFENRCRRVFIQGTKRFVWDRSIIERLFSPAVLAAVARNPSRDILGMPLSDFEMLEATQAKPNTRLKDAARLLELGRGECLVVGGKVVTPWDVVMKPWKTKDLEIK